MMSSFVDPAIGPTAATEALPKNSNIYASSHLGIISTPTEELLEDIFWRKNISGSSTTRTLSRPSSQPHAVLI